MTRAPHAGSALLLPSPLLPDAVLQDLGASLERLGLDTSVARAGLGPREGAADLVTRWAGQVEAGSVLVAHSNAGYLAPHVRAAAAEHLPVVFMDAALPPVSGRHALAPQAFRAWLGELADPDGMLPPWTRWWSRADLGEVVPPERFDALDAACPRLPLTYFDDSFDAPPSWADEPNGYLAFGETYAQERAFAERHGWPVAELDGQHLLFLTAPEVVAEAVAQLVRRLTP